MTTAVSKASRSQLPSSALSPARLLTIEEVVRPFMGDVFGSSTLKSLPGFPTSPPIRLPLGVNPKPIAPVADDAPVVVIHDGGVDYRHTDLDDSMWTNPGEVAGDGVDNDGNGYVDDIHGVNVATRTGDPSTGPELNHGTHVAGIVAAEDNGVGTTGIAAGKVRIMAVAGQFTPTTELQAFEKGVDYVCAMKQRGVNIKVINGSFGDEYRDPEIQRRFTAACQKLLDNDIVFVCAAGNESSDTGQGPFFPANVDLPNVVTVAAMDSSNNRLAWFSNYGMAHVELAAPGSSILSTVPGNRYQRMDGTSMASPYVAGAVGRLAAAYPNKSAAELVQLLLRSVEQDPDLNGKVITGGKVNPANLP